MTEIERRFLVPYEKIARHLVFNAPVLIEQCYISKNVRIRKTLTSTTTNTELTVKTYNGLTRTETNFVITDEVYKEIPCNCKLNKIRFPIGIDLVQGDSWGIANIVADYFPIGNAYVLEVEFNDEDFAKSWQAPSWAIEITEDPRLSNYAIAKTGWPL